ncbi:MAG: hypothetical protein ACHP82_02985 [Hyphomicrobiales bacterium]
MSHIGSESDYVRNKDFFEGILCASEAAMRLFLFGVLVTLTPSMLAVAWLLWQADGAEKASILDVDRIM